MSQTGVQFPLPHARGQEAALARLSIPRRAVHNPQRAITRPSASIMSSRVGNLPQNFILFSPRPWCVSATTDTLLDVSFPGPGLLSQPDQHGEGFWGQGMLEMDNSWVPGQDNFSPSGGLLNYQWSDTVLQLELDELHLQNQQAEAQVWPLCLSASLQYLCHDEPL